MVFVILSSLFVILSVSEESTEYPLLILRPMTYGHGPQNDSESRHLIESEK